MRHINRLISFVLVLMGVFAFSSLARAETIETIYDTPPDIANCQPGILKASEKQKVLDYVNYIRGLHHLAPVEYDAADEETA